MMPIFLAASKLSSTTSNSVLASAGGSRGRRRPARSGHHHGAARGGLDAVDFLQIVAELLGLLERQVTILSPSSLVVEENSLVSVASAVAMAVNRPFSIKLRRDRTCQQRMR